MARLKAQNNRKAQDILTDAAGIVGGARNDTHGDKITSFQLIADFWNLYLDGRRDQVGEPITALNVAQMMELLKIVRSIQGLPVEDHFLDSAGYAAIAGEINNVGA
jgi:hypothetical protein